ncbi:M23 family metallopeptidase [Alistipes shahii]|uniref:M23 family metallopeptidase n=1 Tax=Alistipes shahii TaxID=328814 RepID=UPI00307A8048
MQRFLILFLLTTACLGAQGQQLDPNDYIYPLRELKQRLYSANFGEIRPGHFHAGVDIKTDAEEGKPVVAAADGYVSRVVLQAGGYGRAVYLTLRNGTTVVYGHLRRFRDDIERHVRRERYERRSNGVNLWFGPGTWPVKQGDVVAYSGDSGSSGGRTSITKSATRRPSGSTTPSAKESSAPGTNIRRASCACTTSRSTPCRACPCAASRRATPWSARPQAVTP